MTTAKTFREIATEEVEKSDEDNSSEVDQKEEVKPEATETEVKPEVKPVAPEEIKPFADKPDLKGKTPEELDRIYKEWVTKYTQTRQRENLELREKSAKLAEYEERLKKLEEAGNKVANQVTDPSLQEEKKAIKQDFDLGKLTVQQYTEKMRELSREDARLIAREEFKTLSEEGKEQTYQESALDFFVGADERLDQNNPNFNVRMFKSLATDMANLLDEHVDTHGSSLGFDYKGATTKLIQEYDQDIDELVKSRVQQNTSAVREKVSKFSKSNINGRSVNSVSSEKKGLRNLIEDAVDKTL